MITKMNNDRTALYRHFDKNGILLYVGISNNCLSRTNQHFKNARWFDDVSEVKIEHFKSRRDAEMAELLAIKTENPVHNIVGKRTVKKDLSNDCNLRWKKPKFEIKGRVLLTEQAKELYEHFVSVVECGKYEYKFPYKFFDAGYELFQKLDVRTVDCKDRIRLITGCYTKSQMCLEFFYISTTDDAIDLIQDIRNDGDIYIRNDRCFKDSSDTRIELSVY